MNVSESQREEGQASSHSLAALGYSCRVKGRSAWEGAPGSGAAPLSSRLRQLLSEAPCVAGPLAKTSPLARALILEVAQDVPPVSGQGIELQC